MDWTVFVLCNLYGIPLFCINVRVLYVLRSHRHAYDTVFYRLVWISGIVDCCCYWLNQLFNRWPASPLVGKLLLDWFPEPTYWLTIPYMFSFYTLYLSHMSALVLAINRFTSLLIPLSFERLWKKNARWVFAFYFSPGFLLTCHLLASQTYVSTETDTRFFTYVPVFTKGLLAVSMRMRSLLLLLSSSVLTLLVNLASLLLLVVRTGNAKVQQETHTRLFLFTLCLFGVQVGFVVEQCLYCYAGYVRELPWIQAVVRHYALFCDLTSLAPSVLLLGTSAKLRRHVFQPLRRLLLRLFPSHFDNGALTVVSRTTRVATTRVLMSQTSQ